MMTHEEAMNDDFQVPNSVKLDGDKEAPAPAGEWNPQFDNSFKEFLFDHVKKRLEYTDTEFVQVIAEYTKANLFIPMMVTYNDVRDLLHDANNDRTRQFDEITALQKQIEELREQRDETKALNNAYAAKILRQNKRINDLKAELIRLHEQQLDVQWEVDADEAGLDEETQKWIINSADEILKEIDADRKYVKDLEEENERLKSQLSSQAGAVDARALKYTFCIKDLDTHERVYQGLRTFPTQAQALEAGEEVKDEKFHTPKHFVSRYYVEAYPL